MGSEKFSRLERFVVIMIVLFGLLAFAATIARSDERSNRDLTPDYGAAADYGAAMSSNTAGGSNLGRETIGRERPQTPEEMLRLADEMYQNKRFNDAEKLYEQYINGPETQKSPQNVSTACHRLGLIARKRQQYQKAQDYLIMAMKTDSSQSEQITFDYAQILFDSGEFLRAGNLFQYLASKDPGNRQVKYFYGLSLLQQGAYRQAYPVLLETLGQEDACSLIAGEAKKRGDVELAAEMENVIDQIYAQRDQMFFMDGNSAAAQPQVTVPPTPMFAAAPTAEINQPKTAAQKPLGDESVPRDESAPVEEAVSEEGFASSQDAATAEDRSAAELAREQEAPIPPDESQVSDDFASRTNVAPVQSPVPERITTIPALEKPAPNDFAPAVPAVPAAPIAVVPAAPTTVNTPMASPVLPPETPANPSFALGPATAELPISPIPRPVSVTEPAAEPLTANPNESFALAAVTPTYPQPGVAVVEPAPTESITVPSTPPAPNVSLHERIPSGGDPVAIAPLASSDNPSDDLSNPSLSDLFVPAFVGLLQLPQSASMDAQSPSDGSVSENPAVLPETGAQIKPEPAAQIGDSHPGLLFACAEPEGMSSSQEYAPPAEPAPPAAKPAASAEPAETFLAARPVKSQQSPDANLAEAVAAGVKVDYLTPEQYNDELAKRAGAIVQSTRQESEKIRASRPYRERTKNKTK